MIAKVVSFICLTAAIMTAGEATTAVESTPSLSTMMADNSAMVSASEMMSSSKMMSSSAYVRKGVSPTPSMAASVSPSVSSYVPTAPPQNTTTKPVGGAATIKSNFWKQVMALLVITGVLKMLL